MRYNARKKVKVSYVTDEFGDYGEQMDRVISEPVESIQLVCPMTSKKVKKDYGITTNNPKKIIYNKPLPKTCENNTIFIEIEMEKYQLLERTDFDKFNILLVDKL